MGRELREYTNYKGGGTLHEKGGVYMTFEKRSDFELQNNVRSGCGSCGNCSGDAGATANQADFGAQQSAQRQNKGC